jgi:hypothetical protein
MQFLVKYCYFVYLLVVLHADGGGANIHSTTHIPTAPGYLYYSFDVRDAAKEQHAVVFSIDGRSPDWLNQCRRRTNNLQRDVAAFMCAQVSLGILRNQREILHQ